MGAGKSLALSYFQEHGVGLLETDKLAREILQADPQVHCALRGHFGEGVFDAEGNPDRKALAAVVFESEEALAALEGLLHPRVRERWQDAVQAGTHAHWVVEIPLLFEKKLENHFAVCVSLSVSQATQWARLEQRGWSPVEIEARLARQLSRSDKLSRADVVFSNNGSRSFLRAQVDAFARLYFST